MAAAYREFTGLNLPALEKEVLDRWKTAQTFEQSIAHREGAPAFVFYEGPPSANGMPGIHHVISRTLKDLVCRYQTMRGFQVKRKGGWDTHGLPIELGVEKELGITKEDIGVKISVEEYNRKCREAVLRYKDKWDQITTQMGYWVDLQHPYITFENSYIETLWWLLSELYKKGLLYQSVSIQPYSPAAGTGLSSHELNQPGTYKDVKDTSVVAMFQAIRNERSEFLFDKSGGKDCFFLAWTTTPWTLPSNLGLTVGANIDYVLVKTINPYTHQHIHVVLAENLLGKHFKEEGKEGDFDAYTEKDKIVPWTVLHRLKGSDIEGCRYEQLLPYEANHPENCEGDPFRVLTDSFVTTEDGTGIVHTAPAFGADDYKVGKRYGIGILTMVDREGKFVDGLGEFSGRFVKNYKDQQDYVDVNVDIAVKLKRENRAFKVEKYEHAYPHCWRTDKPILYYPLDAWFIRTTALRDRMVELNKTIRWKPASTGEGRFGNWLENMVDWNLSRSRYWGTPLPIWRTEDGSELCCIGSMAELKQKIQEAIEAGIEMRGVKKGMPDLEAQIEALVADLHKPYVDDIVLISPGGMPMKRVPDLIDVWFDSGAMPYAQWGLPDTSSNAYGPLSPQNFFAYHQLNGSDGGSAFPASFIAEGVDQTRGWFYTLHALGSLLFDSVAYQTVVSNGLVLDKNGNKMSKRLGNVVDPFQTIDKFGADATRWYLVTNASPWDNLKFDLDGIQEVQRKFFGTLYNTYQFFALYANIDGFKYAEKEIPMADRPEIDRWILSSLHTLINQVQAAMEEYEPTQAGRLIEDFVDAQLSNWYVRLCRRRFWKGEYAQDKIAAYQTLYTCLLSISKLAAPIAPFYMDKLYRDLTQATHSEGFESVHLAQFPVYVENFVDKSLESRMMKAQTVSSLVLSLRAKEKIKVRQPLQKIMIPVASAEQKEEILAISDLIKHEVNIKEIELLEDASDILVKQIKPNFKVLGPRFGKDMRFVSTAVQNLDADAIKEIEKQGHLEVEINGKFSTLELSDVEITSQDIEGWLVANSNGITVALDISISEELHQEGIARELVNRIQNIRKDSGFEVTDKIKVQIQRNGDLETAILNNEAYIKSETLTDLLVFVDELESGVAIEFDEITTRIAINK